MILCDDCLYEGECDKNPETCIIKQRDFEEYLDQSLIPDFNKYK